MNASTWSGRECPGNYKIIGGLEREVGVLEATAINYGFKLGTKDSQKEPDKWPLNCLLKIELWISIDLRRSQ